MKIGPPKKILDLLRLNQMVPKSQTVFSAENHNFGSLEFWTNFQLTEPKADPNPKRFFGGAPAGNFKNGSQKELVQNLMKKLTPGLCK